MLYRVAGLHGESRSDGSLLDSAKVLVRGEVLVKSRIAAVASRSLQSLYISLFQISNLMHNSFIFQQYICYITLLNTFRAARCSSSGGPIVSPQPLVSSPSVSSRTVCRWRADCSPLYCTAAYRGWRYQRLWWYNWSSWGWAACCSKHVEDRSVTYILLKNKGIVH